MNITHILDNCVFQVLKNDEMVSDYNDSNEVFERPKLHSEEIFTAEQWESASITLIEKLFFLVP